MPTQAPELETSALPALCVDLDGTLVKSDTLVDSALALARHHPSALLRIPGWLAEGKAALKQHIAATVQLDVAHLPYNRELLQFLEQQRSTGRPIYLATAADSATAHRVADHLGIFTGVLASDGTTNLSGHNKLDAFRQRFGDSFDYVGNALPDLPLLQASRQPMVANPTAGLRAALRRAHITPTRTFTEQVSPQSLAQSHPHPPVGQERPYLPPYGAGPRPYPRCHCGSRYGLLQLRFLRLSHLHR